MGPRACLDGCEKCRPRWGFLIFLRFVLHPYLVLCRDCPQFCLLSLLTTQTSMPPAGFESATPASDRQLIFVLERSATGIGRDSIPGPSSP